VKPDLVLLDEPLSALDVSIRAQILNLLSDLRARIGLALVFISHDLLVVERFADRVLVMYGGRVVEELPAAELARAEHPYTKALLSAVPRPEPGARRGRLPLEGEPPSPLALPRGCAFHTRCPIAEQSCADRAPELVDIGASHRVACPIVAPPPPRDT
jgi:oligopeptide/dipeptide ABC transporter ATP-binding protein